MDQESFRSLLSKSGSSRTASSSRSSLLPSRKSQTASASIPKAPPQKSEDDKGTFKPRKVNNKFRDRAAERRDGINDYAEVEGILADFEERNVGADRESVEEKRKYLGGDEDHTILVKGLDYALLEQNKARAAAVQDAEADSALDDILLSGPSVSALPETKVKRTREERLAAMKRKRAEVEAAATPASVDKLEEAKKMGKFRPIGAPLPSASTKGEEAPKRKKKKRKVVAEVPKPASPRSEIPSPAMAEATTKQTSPLPPQASYSPMQVTTTLLDDVSSGPSRLFKPTSPSPPPAVQPGPSATAHAPAHDDLSDVDIFAEAGEYKVHSESDSSSDSNSDGEVISSATKRSRSIEKREAGSSTPKVANWFGDNDPDLSTLFPAPPPVKTVPVTSSSRMRSSRSRSHSPSRRSNSPEGEDRPHVPTRLQPLMSASGPSIKALLAMDAEAEAEEKKKARKAKRKGYAEGGGVNGGGEPAPEKEKKKLGKEAKLNRDYQQYTSYVEKKTKGGGAGGE